jgi:hypothetical protein
LKTNRMGILLRPFTAMYTRPAITPNLPLVSASVWAVMLQKVASRCRYLTAGCDLEHVKTITGSANESTPFRARHCVSFMRYFCLRTVEFGPIERRDSTEFCVHEPPATSACPREHASGDRPRSGSSRPAILHEFRFDWRCPHSTIAPRSSRHVQCPVRATARFLHETGGPGKTTWRLLQLGDSAPAVLIPTQFTNRLRMPSRPFDGIRIGDIVL